MKLSPRAVFYGILTDTVMSFIIGPLELGFSGVDQHSSFLSISILLLGSASVVLGAYVTASFSRQQWIANVVAFLVIDIVLNVGLSLFVPTPLWLRIIGPLSDIPAAFLGGYLAHF